MFPFPCLRADTRRIVSLLVLFLFLAFAGDGFAGVARKKPDEPPDSAHVPVKKIDEVIGDADDNVLLDTEGVLVIADKPRKPYYINKKSPENAAIRLPKDKAVEFVDDGGSLSYIDRKGDSKLLVKTLNGKKQLTVASGDVEVASSASGNLIPLMAMGGKAIGQIATLTASDSVRLVRTTNQVRFYVGNGRVNYFGGPGRAVGLYRGENARVDEAALLTKVVLGSPEGSPLGSGDPLPGRAEFAPGLRIPYLSGTLARFSDRQGLLDILRDALAELTGSTNGSLNYDPAFGVATYTLGARQFRVMPLGEVEVLVNQFNAVSVSATAGGAFNLASQGIQITLVGAVGYFDDLLQAIRAIDAAGQASIRANGVLEVRLGGARFAVQPGVDATLPERPTPLPGFEAGPDGAAVFRDRAGTIQTLYPAIADTDQLLVTLGRTLPGAALAPRGNGSCALNVGGAAYTLLPDYLLREAPGGHAGEAWWMEGGMVFVRNADDSVQGLRIR